MSWSGGKDSALALYYALHSNEYEVVHLHTTFGEETRRVGMHGVREELIEAQAHELRIPLRKLYLPASSTNDAYETVMKEFYRQCVDEGTTHVVFGDIFLEDLRLYRETLLKPFGLHPVFPLWGKDTKELVRGFLRLGFKTVICSANVTYFSETDAGKQITSDFIDQLPAGVDPCGENGEFHTFVFDGPVFQRAIGVHAGEVSLHTYPVPGEKGHQFWFCDLLPSAL